MGMTRMTAVMSAFFIVRLDMGSSVITRGYEETGGTITPRLFGRAGVLLLQETDSTQDRPYAFLEARQELSELVILHVGAGERELVQQLDILRIFRSLAEAVAEHIQNLGRRALGHGQATPVEDRVLNRITGLGHRRYVGEERVAGRCDGCQEPELLRLVGSE